MAFDMKEYQREYQRKYQKGLHRILLTFNPTNDADMEMWEFLRSLGSRNRIPFIKAAIIAEMKRRD